MNVRAYLSYRQNEVEDDEIEMLEEACTKVEEPIELFYDKKGTKDGESFINFMKNDLTGARFLIVLLSLEYFRTSYTLYEFLKMVEYTSAGGIIHLAPVRATKKMTVKSITEIREKISNKYSSEMQAEIEELTRLQRKTYSEDNDKEIRKEIIKALEDGWNKFVRPSLDKKADAKSEADSLQNYFQKVAKNINSQYKQLLKESQDNARIVVQKNLQYQLESSPKLKNALKEVLKKTTMADQEIARLLLEEQTSAAALNRIAKSLYRLKNACVHSEWLAAVRSAKQMAGWLVLMSINDSWLIHNEHNVCVGGRSVLQVELGKKEETYAEVVISRTVLEEAHFKFNRKDGGVTPDRYMLDALVLDASTKALMEEVLTPIYLDLRKADTGPPDEIVFQDHIVETVNNNFETTDRPTYYLITGETYELLAEENWFQGFTRELSGKLIFIKIDVEDKSCAHNHCNENVAKLLEAVAQIYRFESL